MDKDLEQWLYKSIENEVKEMIDQSGPYTEQEMKSHDMVQVSIDELNEICNGIAHGEIDEEHNSHMIMFMDGNYPTIFKNCERLRHVNEDEIRNVVSSVLLKYVGVE